MILRYPFVRVPALSLSLILLAGGALAQDPPAPPPAVQTPAPTQTPAPSQTPAATQTPATPQTGKKPAEPDYPDPRSLSIGLFYWVTVPGAGPDLQGGIQATGYSSLFGIGKDKPTPGIEIRYPITRTGELRFEGFLSKGTGSQFAPLDTTLFGTSYARGDFLATQYQITTGKLYLDDLLYPFKFPVSKLRFKSLWAIRYLVVKSTFDAPLDTALVAAGSSSATGNRQVILPEFGLAAEYAVAKHVLLRVEGSGFGIPHKSLVWDSAAIVSYRRGAISVEAGFKALGFKTTPNKDEYVRDILDGGFVGIRYYWH